MAKLSSLSVFFPAYNEQGRIATTVKRALKIVPKVAAKWEIIIVDDGSHDRTGAIADGLAKKYSRVRVIHHGANRGYGAAFRSGLYGAKYDWISFTDPMVNLIFLKSQTSLKGSVAPGQIL
jgi:glycosyltransferase involved in cell wall biosynthesis